MSHCSEDQARRVVLSIAMAASGFLGGDALYAFRLLLMIGACTAVSLLATLLTRLEPEEHLEAFFRRVRPGGWWGPIAARCPEVKRTQVSRGDVANWAMTVASIYLALFGLGWLVLGRFAAGAAGLAASLGLVVLILRRVERMDWT